MVGREKKKDGFYMFCATLEQKREEEGGVESFDGD